MFKSAIYICFIFNIIILISGVFNYAFVVMPLNDDMNSKLDENNASLAFKSSKIINAYSEQESIDNIEKIIFLYNKVVAYLDPLEKFMFEANEALVDYSYFILFVSLVNVILISILLKSQSKD